MAEVREEAEERMDNGEDAEDIRKRANVRYDNGEKLCSKNKDRIDGARAALNDLIDDYISSQNENLRFSLFDIGGSVLRGDMTGGKLHLLLGGETPEGAKDPMKLKLYIDGITRTRLDAITDVPTSDLHSAGIAAEVMTKYHRLFATLAGKWHDTDSQYVIDPTTATLTEPVGIDTVTTNSTWAESGESSGEEDSWQLSVEQEFTLWDWVLDLGLAGGIISHEENAESDYSDSTTTLTESSQAGPPSVDVTTTAGADTDVNTATSVNSKTHLFAARLGLVNKETKDAFSKGDVLTFGGDASVLYDWTTIEGAVDIDTTVTTHDTVTDISVGGAPLQTQRVPGSTDNDPSRVELDEPTQSHYAVPVRFIGRLDTKSPEKRDDRALALRLEMGPVFSGSHDGFDFNSLPVAGNATGIGYTNNMIIGGNALFEGEEFNISALFATTKDFDKFVGYVDMVNQMRSVGLVNEALRDRYIANAFHHLLETSQGLMWDLGMSWDSEGDGSFNSSLAYVHQVDAGPLGAMIQGRSDQKQLGGAVYIPFGGGFNGRIEGSYTDVHPVTEQSEWNLGGAVVYHFDGGSAPKEKAREEEIEGVGVTKSELERLEQDVKAGAAVRAGYSAEKE
jgi:hypothetical protein